MLEEGLLIGLVMLAASAVADGVRLFREPPVESAKKSDMEGNHISQKLVDPPDPTVTTVAPHKPLSHVEADQHEAAARRRLVVKVLLLTFGVFILLFAVTGAHIAAKELFDVLWNSPSLRSAEGILQMCRSVQLVAQGQTFAVVSLIMALYLILQTLCIPGTIALNAVCGALLGTPIALVLCVAAGTIGASCCYILSSLIGTRLAETLDERLMQGKGIPRLKTQVTKFRQDLLAYLLFLRLTPVLPNWLINLASPVVSVPLKPFVIATLFGITPQTYLAVRFGVAANTIASNGGQAKLSSVVTIYDTVLIALLGLLALAIGKLKKRFAAAD